jgi:hypothetical protein
MTVLLHTHYMLNIKTTNKILYSLHVLDIFWHLTADIKNNHVILYFVKIKHIAVYYQCELA